MIEAKSLAELAESSGIPARTIRFYIARGLLMGPGKAGRGAEYSVEHLERLEKIKKLQAEGLMLAEIAQLLEERESARRGAPPSQWWQHIVADDIAVWVRADVSPWRMKQIRAAIDEMSSRLGEAKRRNEK